MSDESYQRHSLWCFFKSVLKFIGTTDQSAGFDLYVAFVIKDQFKSNEFWQQIVASAEAGSVRQWCPFTVFKILSLLL